MEVGAVKQAFNNELILLKKKLNQAKIQIIHKLTRKAKTLVEKKAPEALKEKFKHKAQSAVNEVLIMKKIKPRDIGKFILTHKGKLEDYLNKPQVDQDKACARLLLHKVMQDKYKFIRSRFAGVPINDLFMSRAERQKMKKEAKEKQKEKMKKKKNKGAVQGDWDVEDIEPNVVPEEVEIDSDEKGNSDAEIKSDEGEDGESDERNSEVDSGDSDEGKRVAEDVESDAGSSDADDEDMTMKEEIELKAPKLEVKNISDAKQPNLTKKKTEKKQKDDNGIWDVDEVDSNVIMKEKIKLKAPKSPVKDSDVKQINTKIKKPENKHKDNNKNKNLNEKLQNRKFKKTLEDTQQKEVKIVDPFFVTATGENYMSLAEPRQPDEVKEVHKQGNRKLRRAVKFGHAPRIKPRQEFRHDDGRFDRHSNQNGYNNRNQDGYNNKNNSGKFDRGKYAQQTGRYEKGFDKDNYKQTFGKDVSKNHDRRNNKNFTKDNFGDSRRNLKDFDRGDAKPEKLHPSWEAKKRQSGILPFQGKKIVFNEG